MAKTFGAVLGKQSGRIGQIVGRVTRGKQYFAALPTVAKDRKVSSKEQDVRLKFKTLTQLAKGFKQGIKVSLERYAKYAPYITPYNHFVKINKDTVHVYGFTIGAGRDNLGLGSPSAYVGTGNVG